MSGEDSEFKETLDTVRDKAGLLLGILAIAFRMDENPPRTPDEVEFDG